MMPKLDDLPQSGGSTKPHEDQAAFMDMCGQKRYTLLEILAALRNNDRKVISDLAMNMALVEEEVLSELKVNFYNRVLSRYPHTMSKNAEREHHIETITLLCDDLIDIIYVAYSFLNRMGAPIEELWNEVQKSNMAKGVECNHTVITIRGGEQVHESFTISDCLKCNSTGKTIVKRADGKTLKPEGWQPPAIKSIVRSYIAAQMLDKAGDGQN